MLHSYVTAVSRALGLPGGMPIYVARIERNGKALIEHAEVTTFDHVHPASSKKALRLVEISGVGKL